MYMPISKGSVRGGIRKDQDRYAVSCITTLYKNSS
jgi:hypothetical protein